MKTNAEKRLLDVMGVQEGEGMYGDQVALILDVIALIETGKRMQKALREARGGIFEDTANADSAFSAVLARFNVAEG